MSIICSGQLVSLKGGRRNNDDCLFKRGQQLVYSAVQGRRNQMSKGGVGNCPSPLASSIEALVILCSVSTEYKPPNMFEPSTGPVKVCSMLSSVLALLCCWEE